MNLAESILTIINKMTDLDKDKETYWLELYGDGSGNIRRMYNGDKYYPTGYVVVSWGSYDMNVTDEKRILKACAALELMEKDRR